MLGWDAEVAGYAENEARREAVPAVGTTVVAADVVGRGVRES